MFEPHDVLVIGAGPAGLVCAAELRRVGVAATVLERADAPGASWRDHHDGLRPQSTPASCTRPVSKPHT